MPIYEYKCSDGHTFEVMQSMSDDPVSECEVCGEPVERVFHPIAVHFKGSGFYTTDYAKKGAKAASGDGGDKKGDGDSKSESGDSEPKKSSEKAGSGADKGSKGSSSGD